VQSFRRSRTQYTLRFLFEPLSGQTLSPERPGGPLPFSLDSILATFRRGKYKFFFSAAAQTYVLDHLEPLSSRRFAPAVVSNGFGLREERRRFRPLKDARHGRDFGSA